MGECVNLALKLLCRLLPRELAFDLLEEVLAGGGSLQQLIVHGLRHGEIPVETGGVELDLQGLAAGVVADTGDVAAGDFLAGEVRHGAPIAG